MLVVEVLVGLGEADARPAALLPRELVTAAQEAVAPPHELDLHVGRTVLAGLLDVAGELARRAVVLTAKRLQTGDLRLRHGRRDALREEPDEVRLTHAVAAQRAADDVHVQDTLDVPAVVLGELREVV